MALINCPECGRQVSDRAPACPGCGCPLSSTAQAPAAKPAPASPYPCPECGQGFDEGIDLFRHRKAAHRGGWVYRKELVCPHCHTKGQVAVRTVPRKDISGSKATAAVLTEGWSLLATGLSQQGMASEAYCWNCKIAWTF